MAERLQQVQTILDKYGYIVVGIGIIIGIITLSVLALPLMTGTMLKTPFLGGIFNYPILFGVQLYFWLFLLAFLIAVACELFWRVSFWDPITPFKGLYKAYTDNTKAALVGDLNLDWALLSESAATIIFNPDYYRFAIEQMSAWIKFRAWLYKPDFSAQIAATLEGKRDDPTLITIGTIQTHIVIDTEWWTDRNSPQRKAIIKAVGKWNKENIDDQVHRFTTFIKYVKAGKIECPEGVVLEKTIPWARIDAAFPINRSDAAWAGFVRQIAEEIPDMEGGGDMNRWAVYVLVFAAGVCILMFVTAWMFHAAAKPPVV